METSKMPKTMQHRDRNVVTRNSMKWNIEDIENFYTFTARSTADEKFPLTNDMYKLTPTSKRKQCNIEIEK